MTIETGAIIAIFIAIIGSYVFTFTAWRVTTNHVYTKLDGLKTQLGKNHLEVTNRLTALETILNMEKKE